MIDARLKVALEDAALSLPAAGPIAVFNPPVEAQLNSLDRAACQLILDSKPAADAWAGRGWSVAQDAQAPQAACLVCLPRAKDEARAMIAQACALSDGLIVIDGQKSDGVDSILKDIRKRCTLAGTVAKAHGKMFWFACPEAAAFDDWVAGPVRTDGGFWTAPGVFSADGIDPASAMLASVLPERMRGSVVDLGAGWGFLAAHVLTRPDVTTVHLVEAGHMALACAEHNVTDKRARFHWADALGWTPPEPIGTVVMNPPFHRGRTADPGLGQAFVAAAARILGPQGQLWMVANRHLPYEAELKKRFTTVQELGGDSRFKLFNATRPQRVRR